MKELAALGAGIAIAAVAALWFTTGPVLVNADVKPLQQSENMPAFRPIASELAARAGQNYRRSSRPDAR